jgi:nitrous oxide reductase accessory protein NosL
VKRRQFLARSAAFTPFTSLLLAACGEEGNWAEDMTPIKWDRDACVRCKMIISDPRFAVEIKGGPKNTVFKFDDMGCAATWRIEKIKEFPWMTEADTGFWVADYSAKGEKWLNALTAHYQSDRTSPMGYNYAAFAEPPAGSISFDAMTQITSNFWPANCLPTKG